MKNSFSLLPLFIFFSGPIANAAQPIRFSASDLAAFVYLAKPERSTLVIDGRQGKFTPGPSLQFLGMKEQIFDIDMDIGGGLVDLHFNRFQTLPPTLKFMDGMAQIEFPIQDQEKVVKSRFGSISVKNVKLIASIGFRNGNMELTWLDGKIEGELKGSGLLKPRWVMDALKKSALKTLKSQMETQLSRPDLTEALENGLKTWARFTEFPQTKSVVPGSIKITSEKLNPDISYDVE